ncbi:retrotransposon protein, putative, ty1-copia subclass [Tanacetum coccineum]
MADSSAIALTCSGIQFAAVGEMTTSIVLSIEDKLNYLEQIIPPAPIPEKGQLVALEILAGHAAWIKGSKEIDGLMLMTMEPEIQQNLENLHAHEMLQELKTLFAQQEEQELLQTVRDFHTCKEEEGQSVSAYFLKMKSYIDNLEHLGNPVSLNLGVSLILISLRKEFDNFVHNYNMHSMWKTVNEFHAMLKLYEHTLNNKLAPALHVIQAGKGLRASRKLKPRALSLYVGNGQREAVEAIGVFHLYGFVNCFVNNTIQVSRNNMVYFSAIPRDGIFEIDLSNSYANNSSMYAVSNKRAKLDLDYALLWHCRLGDISKKRIEKLQHDGLLNSTDIRDFEKCVSCMFGKMARKPYTHQVKRANDLLGLIHTDVCGPFKIMSRQGASYFVTVTDDFSCYGYVYLLQHKHEVFETFKVFQKEVENQLGKTIKSLRSDRGGEYMSQEFLDHLKDHGIIANLLWDYALETTAHILNMVPTKKVEKTPYKPDKLEPRSIKCIFIGYPKETIGYSFYYPPKNKVLVARNAEFLKNSLITQEASGSLEDLEIIQEEDTHPSIDTSLHHEEDDLEIDEPQSDIVPIRRSTRTRNAPNRICLYIDAEEHKLGDLGEPANYKAALLDPKSDKWLNAMNVKMQSMKDNEVWDLVDLPPNDKTIAKGFTQTYGVDYEETFSHVAEIRAIRILIAISAYYDYEIWKMDVKTAFLNGHLSEEVYMEQPEGFVNPKYPNRKFSFTQNRDEPCVYLKASGTNVTFLILYVDDILIMGNNNQMLQDVKSYIGRCFAMKDLGEAAYILGIKIYRDRSRQLIGLCQSAYIEKILKRYHMENSKRGSIPMQDKLRMSKSQGASTPAELKRVQNVPYASANPGDLHCTTVKNILKYLRNTKDMFLVYGSDLKRELRVSCYIDAGYLTDADDLKSQTGYVFVLNGGAIDWKNAKQSIFATSSAEAEYIAAYDASKEAVWVRKFISGLGVVPTIKEPINMYCDNTRAIAIANESGITKCTRHFRAKVHYLREVIEYGDIKLEKVHTNDNLANPFTKTLAFPKHSEYTRNIRILPASSLM